MIGYLPPVNRLVWIDLGELDREGLGAHPSRVEGVDGDLLTLSAPSFAGDVYLPAAGSPLTLRWTGQRGVCALPVEFAAVEHQNRGDGGVPLWQVSVTGAVRIEQRRRFTRAEADVPVRVRAPGRGTVIPARLLDLGEGGIRCRLSTRRPPADGEQVMLRIGFDARLAAIAGTVRRIVDSRPDACEAVIEFDLPEGPGGGAVADTIRQFVMQQQALAARSARD